MFVELCNEIFHSFKSRLNIKLVNKHVLFIDYSHIMNKIVIDINLLLYIIHHKSKITISIYSLNFVCKIYSLTYFMIIFI